jgi:hypothetical protein
MTTLTDSLDIIQKRAFIAGTLDFHSGAFFTVTFIKADGSVRVMNGRTGVTKHLKGGESTIKDKPNLYGCFDVKANGYRCFNMDTVLELKVNKVTLKFPGGGTQQSEAA